MTDSPRDRARALLAAATPGKWEADEASTCVVVAGSGARAGYPPRDGCIASLYDGEYIENRNRKADAALIAAAPELLTALCDELDRAEAKVERLRAALRKTSDLIAANRLVLGEYTGPRYVAQVEDAARAALAESEETT